MRISGYDRETYFYLNGIGISKKLKLGDNIELLPANCSPNPSDIISVSKSEVDIGVISIFLRQVRSQFHIMAGNPKALVVIAWNSLWDALLLSALFDCEAVCNFQCDKPAEEFGADCKLEITNYHLRGLTDTIYAINDEDHAWIEQHFQTAKKLLNKPKFQNAVHCLATYRWHSLPRARLSLIWSGIEGLFDVETELVFRLSLYIARFLAPTNYDDMKTIFSNVKKLYTQRSSAVHGSKIKGEVEDAVNDSAELLRTLLKQCIIIGDLPRVDELAP
jgi:hypothetical protein